LWLERISKEKHPYEVMKNINPQVIPRNHLLEQALTASQASDDTLFNQLLAAVQTPFTKPSNTLFATPGQANEPFITYCGT
jgi:uncharacterized protein YdiU (UPF0061 family)